MRFLMSGMCTTNWFYSPMPMPAVTLTLFEDVLSSLLFLLRLSDVNNYPKRRRLRGSRKLIHIVTLRFGTTRELETKISENCTDLHRLISGERRQKDYNPNLS